MQATVTAGWLLKGSKPKAKSFAARSKASCIGFEMPGTGELLAAKAERLDCMSMIGAIRSFLARHSALDGRDAVIIWDNAPYRKKAMKEIERGEEHADIRENAVFLCLPPHSPGLNPIEQAWRIARRERTRNKFFPNLNTLVEAVEKAFAAWPVPNEQPQRLCSFA